MKVKKAIKKIVALGIGATMLGATMLGASAQLPDLADYPAPFDTNGVFNGYIITHSGDDALAAIDISNHMYTEGTGATEQVSVTGDAWKVGTSTEVLEIGESIRDQITFIDSGNLGALADGTFSNSKGSFSYEQFLYFDEDTNNVTYEESDDDVTDIFFKVHDGAKIVRYRLDFTEAAETDIDSSDSYALDDYEDKEITMLGETFTIVQATSVTAPSDDVTLILMSGAVKGTLALDESQDYEIDNEKYTVTLNFVDDTYASFTVKGETTAKMEDGETFKLSDGLEIGLTDIKYQGFAGGVMVVDFFLGANKLELQDTAITDTGSDKELKVNEETIDGADVIIYGTNTTVASTTADGELEIDYIEINMTAQDDYWVAAGDTLSAAIADAGDETGILFTENWDIEFKGLSDEATEEIKLSAKASDDEYWLTFENLNGDTIEFPLAYTTGAGVVALGSEDDLLILNNTAAITKDQYFIVNTAADEDSISEVLRYRGADKTTDSDPKLKVEILSTGETVSRSLSTSGSDFVATMSLNGKTYTFTNVTSAASDDFSIKVTGGTDNAAQVNVPSGMSNFVITQYGGQIYIADYNLTTNTTDINLTISQIDGDRGDDVSDPEVIAIYDLEAGADIGLNWLAGATGSLITPEDDDDNSYGYSIYGAFVQENDPDSGASSLTITMPEQQLSPQLYVTSGSTETVTTTGGSLNEVTIPLTATKRADEVANLAAQNVIIVGGPCANPAAAEIMYGGSAPADCAADFTPGEAMIKYYENGNNVALLVAGYSVDDTRRAGKVLAEASKYALSGSEVVVKGSNFMDISVDKVA